MVSCAVSVTNQEALDCDTAMTMADDSRKLQ